MRWRKFSQPAVLVLVLATVLATATTTPAVAIGSYNRSAAVAYADQWSSNTDYGDPPQRNTAEFPNFGNDCTNFVSQVLLAGGYPQTGWRDGACYYWEWYRPQNIGGFWRYTHSWTVADCQRLFFSNKPTDFELWGSSPEYLSAGDILQMDAEYAGYPTHSRVMMGSGYDIISWQWHPNLINQHTSDRKRRFWQINVGADWRLWPWHINW